MKRKRSTKRKDERINVNLPSNHKKKKERGHYMKKILSYWMYVAGKGSMSNLSFNTFH